MATPSLQGAWTPLSEYGTQPQGKTPQSLITYSSVRLAETASPTCRPYGPSLPHQLAITSLLATSGSDDHMIIFSLQSFSALQRLAAHDASVAILQFDANFLITGG
ncbi:hypothetical protein BDR05DRAFT_960089 [Suillus weaverae]|nr:hypothetical protein BDR05DRAFT_960089 [Suillus weaverae]